MRKAYCLISGVRLAQVTDFASLHKLMLLEDFKRCLPKSIVQYLNGQKTTTLSTTAVLADEFALTHKNVFSTAHCDKNNLSVPQVHSASVTFSVDQLKEKCECFYCHKVVHVIADCLMLKKKQQVLGTKSVVFVNAISPSHTDLIYKPFMLKGFVSFSGNPDDQVQVQVLLDTGAVQSFMCGDVFPFSEQSNLGSSILVQGIGMEVLKVQLHCVHLQTVLVIWFVNERLYMHVLKPIMLKLKTHLVM